jgi:hypothetical protein
LATTTGFAENSATITNREYFMKRLSLLIPLLAPAGVSADTLNQGIEVYCGKDEFLVQNYNVVNGAPVRKQRPGSTVFSDSKEHRFTCIVNGHDVAAEVQLYEPQAQNECGTKPPGGRLTLTIDKEKYLNHSDIDACFDTLSSARVSKFPAPSGTFAIELCGSTNPNFMPRFEGCVTALRDDLRTTPKPLNRRFPASDLLKAMKF